MSIIRVKRGDSGIIFSDTLTADGEPINLEGATVTFLLRAVGGAEPAVEAEAIVVDDQDGTVSYVTAPGDLEVSGVYRQEWEIVYEAGDRFTVPSDTQNVVRIIPDLNAEVGS